MAKIKGTASAPDGLNRLQLTATIDGIAISDSVTPPVPDSPLSVEIEVPNDKGSFRVTMSVRGADGTDWQGEITITGGGVNSTPGPFSSGPRTISGNFGTWWILARS